MAGSGFARVGGAAGTRSARHGGHGRAECHRRRSCGARSGRQRSGCGRGGGLRAGRHASFGREHRRRRIHASAVCRWALHVPRFSRARARKSFAQHVSGRLRQGHQRKRDRLSRGRSSGLRARLRARFEKIRPEALGGCGGARGGAGRERFPGLVRAREVARRVGRPAGTVPRIEAHLPARRQAIRSRRDVHAARNGAHAPAHPGARRARFL